MFATTSMPSLTHTPRCDSAAIFASLEHAIAVHQHALYTHHAATGARTQQVYPTDGAQQEPSAMPDSIGAPGSWTHSVVHSQSCADRVMVARDTTKQVLFQRILKKQALKQELERLAEINR
jgi:hypothetical protein